MKILTIALSLGCVALLVALFLIKRNDNAQFDTDTGAFIECSNTMVAAQAQVDIDNGSVLNYSNNLNDCQSALLTCSNNLVAAQSTIAADSNQITNLTRQVAQLGADSQAYGQSVMDMTNQLNNQIIALDQQVALTETNMAAVEHDHVLLEERLRRDVAERLVAERKFYPIFPK